MKLSQFLFVSECAVCKRRIKYGAFCPVCASELRENIKYDVRIENDGKKEIECHFAFAYKGNEPVKNFLFSLKEDATIDLFRFCTKIYSEICNRMGLNDGKVFVTYVPRSRKNLHKYGYDQSKVCAKHLAKKSYGKFEYKNLITRKLSSTEQKHLDKKQRIENTNNKFRIRRFVNKDIKPDTIIIIDDVVTTANSVIECAKVLRKEYGEDVNIYGAFIASN